MGTSIASSVRGALELGRQMYHAKRLPWTILSVTTAQMRRTTLVHGVLSFIFNMAVLAMSINVISGVI
jgi:hypothetical protein